MARVVKKLISFLLNAMIRSSPAYSRKKKQLNSGTATSETIGSHQTLIGGIAYGGYARKV